MFKSSLLRLKNSRTITMSAMYIALYVVLYSAKIPIALESRLSVTFIPVVAAAYLMGPSIAMIVAAVGDLLGCIFFPAGQYFPGFTLSAILNGLIFGVFLYRANTKLLLRSFLAVLMVTLFVNIIINTIWLAIMYQKAFMIYFGSRLIKNMVTLPIEVLGTMLCIKFHDRTGITKYYI